MWFNELPWGLMGAQWYQNFPCTTTTTGGHFKPKTGEFGQREVDEVVLRKFVTPGRSTEVPKNVSFRTTPK